MDNNKNIALFKKLLEKAKEITIEDSQDPTFKVWKSTVERAIIKVYGDNSFELQEFRKLKFYYDPISWNAGDDFTYVNLVCFRDDYDVAIRLINSFIEDLIEKSNEEMIAVIDAQKEKTAISKVFISHASNDINIVEEVIEILETIGLRNDQIFCSSFGEYGIELGENSLQRLKEELNENILVIFILTKNFYASPYCLCEMGAVWIKTNEHIPILVPPFDYAQMKGVLPLTQGFKINENLKFNQFKAKIEATFNLQPINFSNWERRRDRIVQRIEKIIAS